MIRFESMRMFVEVVNEKGFTAAAKRLGITPAAVSQQVSALEKEIRIQLLIRTTRNVELTDQGRLFYDRCARLLREFEEAQNFAALMHGEPQGELRVLSTRYFGEKFILPHLKEFLHKYPALQLELELAERIPDLVQEKIDIFFAISLPGAPDWIQKTIAKTKYIFCASPQYLEKFGTPESPEDLKRHHYISHVMRKPHKIVDFGQGTLLQLEPSLVLNDTYAMLQCARAGIGIVRLHSYMVAESLAEGSLTEIFQLFNDVEVPIKLYYQPSQFVQPKIRHFIEYFSAKIHESPLLQGRSDAKNLL